MNKEIFKEHYGLSVSDISTLEGYGSKNYKISGPSFLYVFKWYEDSNERALIEAENELLCFLSEENSFDVPVPIHMKDSKNSMLSFNDEHESFGRLISFLDGEFLKNVEHTEELLFSFGRSLARLNLKLKHFNHPVILARQLDWDIQNFCLNEKYFNDINCPSQKALVEYFYLQYNEVVLPNFHQLRKQLIHCDANTDNVLVDKNKVSGFIDFGDIVYSPLINEVAIACAYVALDKKSPIESIISIIKGYHSVTELQELELDMLYYLIAARLCISVCHSAHFKKLNPDSQYITTSEKSAWELLFKWLAISPIYAAQQFKKSVGLHTVSHTSISRETDRRSAYFCKSLSLTYSQPIMIEKAAFQYMYDSCGNTYLDIYNNIPHVGHSHPTVVKAGQRQMAKLNTNTRYLYPELNNYAERLLSKFPINLNKVFFVNSGSAATDLALRLARVHTKAKDIVVMEHGYHGNTQAAVNVSHYKYNRKGGEGKKNYIHEIPLPKGDYSSHNPVHQTLMQTIDAIDSTVAAFICEPVVGCGGQVPLPKSFLSHVYQQVRKKGGVCISDEVQTGFGRLGDVFWGYELQEVVPDIVILGKPMGNGHPISAVVTTTEIAESFENGMEFFSSFGGNTVSCAIGNAVLDVIENEELQIHAKNIGDYLRENLEKLKKRFTHIGEVRGSGLFLGIEFINGPKNHSPNTQLANHIKNQLKEKFILVGTDGPYDNVIKIKPPMCFSKENADLFIKSLTEILESTG